MATYSNLSYGSKGDDVKKMQTALINAGYSVGSSGADGSFGPATQAAVKKYQADNGLAVDGIAGSNTLGKLYETSTTSSTAATSSGTTSPEKPTAPKYDPVSDTAYQEALAALQQANKNTPKYAGTYDGQLKDLYDQIVNRDKFSYDINADMLYKQYANQYILNGKLAMMDSMGQAASLNGGYGSSYGQAVGQQTYNAYLQQLSDIVPELYAQAYDQYNAEGDKLLQQYAMIGDLADDEYGKYQDAYTRWANERDYAQEQADTAYDRGYNDYLAKLSQYNADREYELTLEQWNYKKEQDAKAAAAASSSGRSGGGGYKGTGGGGDDEDSGGGKVEKFSSSRALNEAVANGSTYDERLVNLKAMLDEGNITEKQYKDLVFALNPRYSYK